MNKRAHVVSSTSIVQTSLPIIADNETEETRRDYISLLQKIVGYYNMRGLPSNSNELFHNYELPNGVPVRQIPDYVFISYPQRPKWYSHDFSKAEAFLAPSGLPYKQLGPANVLFNEDFTIVLGRLGRVNRPGYGYGLILLRNDKDRVYTNRHVIFRHRRGPKPYCAQHSTFLDDLQEMVVIAFYRPQYRTCLEKYRENNPKIADYLDKGYVKHAIRFRGQGKFVPITCFACREAKYIAYEIAKQQAKARGISCPECYAKRKKDNDKEMQAKIFERNSQLFRKFASSSEEIIAQERDIQDGIQIEVTRGYTTVYAIFYETGKWQIQQGRGRSSSLQEEITLWCDNNLSSSVNSIKE